MVDILREHLVSLVSEEEVPSLVVKKGVESRGAAPRKKAFKSIVDGGPEAWPCELSGQHQIKRCLHFK